MRINNPPKRLRDCEPGSQAFLKPDAANNAERWYYVGHENDHGYIPLYRTLKSFEEDGTWAVLAAPCHEVMQ